MSRKRGPRLATTLFVLLVGATTLTCAATPPEESASGTHEWPPGTPELPADPAVHFARLENGVRIAWMYHPQPASRCSLRLVVKVGSLDEGDDERGMAHFVEHMAFNGTRRFPGDSIRQWLASHGLGAGLHANAFTSYSYTIYKIELPNNDAATIADGLDVLRQFADGLLFDPAEVEAERRVIDAEEREQSSPRGHAMETMQNRLAAGHLRAQRNPFGVATQRAAFTVDALRSFYERWYRADNMTLVLVGDLAADVEPLCQATFGVLRKAAAPSTARADRGSPTLAETSFAVDQPARTDVEFFVQCLARTPRVAQSPESLRAGIRREAAAEMLRWQLHAELVQKESPVLSLSVGADRFDLGDDFASIAVAVRCESAHFAEALSKCARVLKESLEAGVDQGLVDRVRESGLARLGRSRAAFREATSVALAQQLAECLAKGETPVAATASYDLCHRAWIDLSSEACTKELRAAWACAEPSIVSIGPPGHGIDAAAIWAKAMNEGKPTRPEGLAALPEPAFVPSTPPERPSEAAVPAWPYTATTTEPAPQPAERAHHVALDVEDVHFDNGVRVLVKRTGFVADQVLVCACVGSGVANLEPPERHAVVALQLALPAAELDRIGYGDLRRVVDAHRATMQLSEEPRRFELRGRTDRASLAFQLEWLRAVYTDLKIDGDKLDVAIKAEVARISGQQDSSDNVFTRFLGRLVDEPIGCDVKRLAAVDMEDVQRLLNLAWRSTPITLTIVGDVDVEVALAIAARTFGRLPKRERPESIAAKVQYREAPVVLREQQDLATTEASSVVFVVAPLDEASVRGLAPGARLLVRILNARMESRVREEMGASYAPRVHGFEFASSFRSWALLARIRVAPLDETRILDAALNAFEAVRTNGVTALELEQARRELRNQWREELSTNEKWLADLAGTHGQDLTLEDLAAAEAAVGAITIEDLAKVAAALAPERLSTLVLRGGERK